MAEAEEQPSASPQNEGRSEGGEEAPDGGAAAGAADPSAPPAVSPGTEEPAGDTKKKSNGARSHRRGGREGLCGDGQVRWPTGGGSGWLWPMRGRGAGPRPAALTRAPPPQLTSC